ncbi:helix-turn-helix domain-containing protein [Streptomyces montanisoli]|uniref:Helix-turn-helix transcriptional regulator n=1 Tax=Streptomyces montanisoli TaxID=2798581 RepID=A0A940RZG3_9ACTN|nr:helix-turn-helix transcriptional regulator [Streptomyces montanisoli]MBP0459759.1 helix-turn-helix transcriptional regulator [Streptomyces montanisoli]
MPASPSPSAQAAREAVAHRLRDMRRTTGLTIAGLAAQCGWHHAKTSRIENARTAPTATDIRKWCTACGYEDQAERLIAKSLHAEEMYREWREQTREGMRRLQESAVAFFRETALFRVYSSTMVPGLLQTEGYAAALLSAIADFREIEVNDGPEAARARVERSHIIHESGRRFVFLLEEGALRYQLGETEAMAAQLGYLLAAGALPTVSMGIIPDGTRRRRMWPQETFHVYDDRLVSVELLSAEVTITQPSEVRLYLRAFEELRSMAVYGQDARALIVKAIDAL